MDTLTPAPSPALARRRAGALERYVVAVLAAAAAVGPHAELHRLFGASIDPIFLVVVALSTGYGGFGAGVVTLVLLGLGALATTGPPTSGSPSKTSRMRWPCRCMGSRGSS
ncbi:MAG: hypothetical protein ABI860_11820 [Gemmatimonadales bacterium]